LALGLRQVKPGSRLGEPQIGVSGSPLAAANNGDPRKSTFLGGSPLEIPLAKHAAPLRCLRPRNLALLTRCRWRLLGPEITESTFTASPPAPGQDSPRHGPLAV